jgi:hypothetical protein
MYFTGFEKIPFGRLLQHEEFIVCSEVDEAQIIIRMSPVACAQDNQVCSKSMPQLL